MTNDETENLRRQRLIELNCEPGSREALEAKYGKVWSTDDLRVEFEVLGFMAPFVIVANRETGQRGSLEFQHQPRFFFNWQPE